MFHLISFNRGHDPKDFFKVWKENCMIGKDLNLDIDKDASSSPIKVEQEAKNNFKNKNKNVNDHVGNSKKLVSGATRNQSTSGLGSLSIPKALSQRAPVVVRTCIIFLFHHSSSSSSPPPF